MIGAAENVHVVQAVWYILVGVFGLVAPAIWDKWQQIGDILQHWVQSLSSSVRGGWKWIASYRLRVPWERQAEQPAAHDDIAPKATTSEHHPKASTAASLRLPHDVDARSALLYAA